MLISDKIGFKAEAVKKDKEGQYINIIINGQYKDRILHLSTYTHLIKETQIQKD